VKRPSCGVKGQIGTDDSVGGAGSPFRRMPSRTEGGLQPAHQPFLTVTRPLSQENTPTILTILIKMKNDGRSDHTIRNTSKLLKYLNNHANLNDPETVKTFIASLDRTDGYKRNLCIAYNKWCKHNQIQWEMPQYQENSQLIKIPTKEKVQMLIANAGTTLATKMTLSMETGLRPVELCRLTVKDLEQRLVYPHTAKHGAPRTLKMSNHLTELLTTHIASHDLNPTDKLFKGDSDYYGKKYRAKRNQLAKKLQDPTIKQIRLYDLRHYFATMLYHKTKDILHVKAQMGHKKLQTTLIYTQLLSLNEDEWTCKTATNITEATQLIEAGFEYVTEIDDTKLFRKRK